MSRSLIIISLLFALPVLAVIALYLWFIYSSPLNINEMDLNKNGWVSFTEAEYTASYGSREQVVNGKSCTEFYSLKDGLPLKVLCSERS